MKKILKNKGFTLIEIMVAVTLFTIIMTLGSTAVLNTNAIYKRNANIRAAIDNLNFVMEDMARNLRLGSNYNCDGATNCPTGGFVLNFDAVGGNPMVYAVADSDQDGDYEITKNDSPVTLPEIQINEIESAFIVDGVGPDGLQPMVTIKISGNISYKEGASEFDLQTTVSQRLLENPK